MGVGRRITGKVFTMLQRLGKEERLEEWETRQLGTGHLDTGSTLMSPFLYHTSYTDYPID